MMKSATFRHALPATFAGLVLLSATSCASLFGNANCHCTHAGQCGPDQPGRVIYQTAAPKDTTIDSLMQALLSKDYSLEQLLPEEPKRLVWVDEAVSGNVTELSQHMKVSNGWTMPRGVTTDNTENAIYFYFTERADGTADQLRLRVQYYADDPLQFEKLHFVINGFDYYFTPTNFNRGKGKGIMIWENSDDPLTVADKDLVYALTHCEWCKLIIIGKDGMQHVKMISDSQFADFKHTLELYRLKGGTF